jgi:serine/threonine protein kinase
MPRLDEFVGSIVRSGLLAPDDLEGVRQRFSPEPAADAAVRLAQLLIDERKLSHYQARKLLAGATKGFFLGDYVIDRRLGQGGMGKVFLAHRKTDGAQVAIKVLPPRKAEDAQALARFRRETELTQRVNHPNLARTLDVGTGEGVHFMVMEYVPGDSLFHMIRGKGRGPWRVPDAVRYFLQVLDGLQAAHAAGLVHRDIKPSNLMVTPEGSAKILDLGLARALDDSDEGRLTRPDLIVGTLDYASPEQLSDAAKADQRSDVYSLGCTLYFTLAGRPPFGGGDAINKIFKQRMVDAPPLERVAPGVPPAFAAIVRKMMAKNPADRYQDVCSLRNDLVRWTDPEVVRALVGPAADSATPFRPPPPELDEEDLRLSDEATPSSLAKPIATITELGDAEPAPAPRNPAPPPVHKAVVIESRAPAQVPREPKRWKNVSVVQLVAATVVLVALVVVIVIMTRH